MSVPIFVPIVVTISSVLSFVVTGLILSKKEQTNQKMTWLLVGTMISIALWVILTSFQLGPLSIDENLIGFAISAMISNLMILLGILFLSIFITYLIRPSINLTRMITMTSMISATTTLYVVMLVSANGNDRSTVDLTLSLVNLINFTMLTAFLFWVKSDIRIFKSENLPDNLRKQVNRFYLALMVGYLGNLPIFVLSWVVDQRFLAFSYLLIPVSLSFLAYNYYLDPRVAFILSERTYLTIVVNTHGALKYEKIFASLKGEDFTVIISGVLNAITGIMSEFYDNPVRPQLIQFQNRMILLKWAENYFLAVFTDRDSPLIRTAMDNTVNGIQKKFGEQLNQLLKKPDLIKLDDIFDETFYFVIPQEIE